jgi:hypothetical protein
MPVLMLGGARDEVVPRSQMQELWAIIRNRGRDAAAVAKGKMPPAGDADGAKEGGGEEEGEDEKKGEAGSGSSRPRGPAITVDGLNTYIEFDDGMHSEYFSIALPCLFLCFALCFAHVVCVFFKMIRVSNLGTGLL